MKSKFDLFHALEVELAPKTSHVLNSHLQIGSAGCGQVCSRDLAYSSGRITLFAVTRKSLALQVKGVPLAFVLGVLIDRLLSVISHENMHKHKTHLIQTGGSSIE